MLPRVPLELVERLRGRELSELRKNAVRHGVHSALIGASGSGKSTILQSLRSSHHEYPFSAVIDLGSARNRSLLGLAASLLKSVHDERVEAFFQAAASALLKGTERATRDALSSCEEIFRALRDHCPVFLFDNIDKASMRVRTWLFSKILNRAPITSISAARTIPPGFPISEMTQVFPLDKNAMHQLADFWGPYVKVRPEALSPLLLAASSGHPVEATLAAWSLSLDPPTKVEGIDLLALMRTGVSRLDSSSRDALAASVIAYQRINADIIEGINAKGDEGSVFAFEPRAAFEMLENLPFVTPIDDDLGGVVLHSSAVDALGKGMMVSLPAIEQGRSRLATYVYPRLANPDHGRELLSVLELERLRYLASLSTMSARHQIESAFRSHLRAGRLSRADDVAQIAEEAQQQSPQQQPSPFLILAAENRLALHEVSEAQQILSEFKGGDVARAPVEVQLRVRLLRARCTTSPAAPSGVDIFTAAPALEAALAIAIQHNIAGPLAEEIEFELGEAYRLAGHDSDALSCYQRLELHATEPLFVARAIDEQSNLYRLMGDVSTAEQTASRVNSLRFEKSIDYSSFSLHCLANIRRDGGRFEAAGEQYARALEKAEADSDDYRACVVRGEWAWMKFLAGDIPGCVQLLTEYEQLASAYGFSRELSELWHMRYHVAMSQDLREQAYRYLDVAARLASDHGNLVMRLDCLMHMVQRCVAHDDFDTPEKLIEEMKQIEARGCQLKVFRGRASIYWADGLVASRRHDAVLLWKEGFETVARHGQSRSNVEMLSDLLSHRRQTALAAITEMEPDWPSHCDEDVKLCITTVLAFFNNPKSS